MADKRISQLIERVDIANDDVLPIVASGATTTNKVTVSTLQDWMQDNLDVGVTSVGITIGSTGTDVNVTGSPVTSSGNITINIPTASATNRGLLSSADWTTFNSKQPAGNYVTLDTTQTITAQKTFTTSGGSDSVIITTTGSGFALDAIKAGNGEVIRVNKTSGTGNAMTVIGGNFEAPTIVKTGGTSSQFLKADGSVDSTAYTTNTGTVTSVSGTGTVSGLSLSGTVTTSGNLTLGGTLSLTSANVTDALGFTPYNATNPAGYTTNVGTVTSVAALTLGTSGTDLSSTVANGTTTPVITLNVPDASATARGVVTTGTQTIAGAKTLTSPLNGTTSIFSSAFASNQTSKVGIGFESGYGLINAWGADASTFAGLKFQISESDGNTYDAIRINPDGTLFIPSGGYYGLIDAAFLRVGGATAFSQALTPPVAKFVNSANNFVKIALGQGETYPGFNDYYGIIALDNNVNLADNKLRFYLGYDDAVNSHDNDQLVIQGNGNVGIGTASPATTLEIFGINQGEYLRVGGGTITGRSLTFSSFDSSGLSGVSHRMNVPNTNGQLSFAVGGVDKVNVTNNGLTFNGDTAAANALDDYEEGTFTPTIIYSTSNTPAYYGGGQLGRYTKIGRIVQLQIYLNWDENGSTGNISLGGLPFTSINSQPRAAASILSFGFVGISSSIIGFVNTNSTTMTLGINDNNLSSLTGANTDNDQDLYVTLVYEVV